MRMKKIKVYTLINERESSKCIGIVKGEDRESLAELRMCLEDQKILKFEFQFWDRDECCRVAINFESLDDLED